MFQHSTSSSDVVLDGEDRPMHSRRKILVIEDDHVSRTILVRALAECGFEAIGSADFSEALTLAETSAFDALVVDRMLPSGDGLEIVRTLRSNNITTPAVFLTAMSEVGDRIAGLRAGGDDYLAKPFSFMELVARLEAVIRRANAVPDTILRVADLEMNLIARTVRRGDTQILLVAREFQVLEFLMKHAGQTVTRAMLLEQVWQHLESETKIMDVLMSRLRRKIDPRGQTPLIHTVRGSGYCISASKPTPEL